MTENAPNRVVFLLDVDNTLLDNDRMKSDIDTQLRLQVGNEHAERFWQIYEQVRTCEDYVDYPATVEAWSKEVGDAAESEQVRSILDDIDFASYLYPHVLETIAHMQEFGPAVILSDGDQVFQPMKIERSGLAAQVEGRVLIYVHKEQELPEVFKRFPAQHYVMVDDKPRILAALEECCPTEFTTILVLQGKYAVQGEYSPAPDYVVPAIADLVSYTLDQFLHAPA